MMHPYYYHPAFFPGFGLLGFLIILGVLFLVWAIAANHQDHDIDENEEKTDEDSALEILKKRYAKGEITKREYLSMKKDIS